MKAIEAAVDSRQWTKAVSIIERQDPATAARYYRRLAGLFEMGRDYEQAERFYVLAAFPAGAVEMYARADKWDHVSRARARPAPGAPRSHRGGAARGGPVALSRRACGGFPQVAASYLSDAEKEEIFSRRARELVAAGSLKDAERMFLNIRQHDAAISMYRQARMYDAVIRLVSTYRKADLQASRPAPQR